MLTAVFAVIAMVSVNAQNFGVKAGLNVANLSGDISGNKALIGFKVGAFTEFELSETLILQPELMYSSQGTKFKEEGISVDFKLNYINLPIMFKYAVAEGFYLEAGPQVGFLVSAKVEDFDVKDEMESVDFGANFGFSYDFTEKLFAGARYNFGLSNVAKDSGDDSVKNSVFSFSLGYKF